MGWIELPADRRIGRCLDPRPPGQGEGSDVGDMVVLVRAGVVPSERQRKRVLFHSCWTPRQTLFVTLPVTRLVRTALPVLASPGSKTPSGHKPGGGFVSGGCVASGAVGKACGGREVQKLRRVSFVPDWLLAGLP